MHQYADSYVSRWDCITINEKPVSESLFREIEAQVLQRNQDDNVHATEFELLTATAFDIFTRENVDVGVVEVGMGGRDDATNILKSKALTIITRIGLDHQAFLGNTVEEITRHKCGIFVKDVPVLYNATNDKSIVETIKDEANRVGAQPLLASTPHCTRLVHGDRWASFAKQLAGREQQRVAISQAWQAFDYLQQRLFPMKVATPDTASLLKQSSDAIMNVQWPGRLQRLDIASLVAGADDILLDGAHNAQAAENLATVVNTELRTTKDTPVTWVLASTRGRDVRDFLAPLLRHIDRVIAVEFSPVDGMPWVQALPAVELVDAVRRAYPSVAVESCGADVTAALRKAADNPDASPVVVTGSLYLASDVLRLLRNAASSPASDAK